MKKLNSMDLYDIRSQLTEEECIVQDTVARFVDESVIPIIGECFENSRFPMDLVPLVADLGLLGSTLEGYGCAALMASATNGLAQSLGSAILNQDDPETVRDGAPAFLLMLDSFVESTPGDTATLIAAAELYAAYGTVFVDDPARARRLTTRSRTWVCWAVPWKAMAVPA